MSARLFPRSAGRAWRLVWVAVLLGLIFALAVPGVATASEQAGIISPPADAIHASVAAAPADAPDSASKGKWIEVILSQQKLIAWENGKAVMVSRISSGVRRYPTRPGTFKIYVKYRSTRMRGPGYNLPNVPWTMYYSGSFAIHGAYWHNNFGHPMSHGCVNLPVAFARKLFAWAPLGTRVVVH